MMTKSNLLRWSLAILFLAMPFIFLGIVPKYTLDPLMHTCLKDGAVKTEPPKLRFKHCLPIGKNSKNTPVIAAEAERQNVTKATNRVLEDVEDSRLVGTLAKRAVRDPKKPETNRFIEHVAKRYSYSVALFTLLVSSLVLFAYTVATLMRHISLSGEKTDKDSDFSPMQATSVFLVAAAVLITMIAFFGFGFQYESVLWLRGVARIVVVDPLNQINAALNIVSQNQHAGFSRFLVEFFRLHQFMFYMFVVSLVCVSAVLASLTILELTEDKSKLGENRKHLDFFLTLVAIHLAVFVLYVRQFVQIAYPFLNDVQNAQLLGGAVVQYWSAASSLLLIVVFGIGFAWHQSSARSAAAKAVKASGNVTAEAISIATKEAGAEKSPYDRLIDVLKVLLPLISGVAFEISGLIGI